MKTSRFLAGIVVAGIAGIGGAVASHWLFNDAEVAHAAAPSHSPVDQLWAAQVTNVDGKPQSLAAFKGHPVVINFWASWCAPCVEEMPSLSALHREYQKKGIEFVGLGVDSDKNIKAFLQKVQVDYPVFVTGFGGADLARAFGNNAGGLPYTVVIDAKGNVRSTKLGQIVPKELKQTLDAL
ncbi:TlpA disulfide reductase family protein [Paraburkholderia sp.]|uniref:TlpA family protein disulfide reductase n=1 Tax=Paraburkholderia sp. TaxID=1926495 RepID=UPI0023A673D9|nr:TlpA disulfide reductase family protein [Paraburkholderia sp.]MDE1183262.1 TlpA disulfide reductase family protein [Paraburkholderia sp.]